MKDWIKDYIESHKKALDTLEIDGVAELIEKLKKAHSEGKQIFSAGNGGSAANSSHFMCDLGKGSSDKLAEKGLNRFRCLSLNDNVAWMTAIGNDYSYDDVFSRQLENYAAPGDILILISVSGGSPNLVKAAETAKKAGVEVIALLGGKRGALINHADFSIVIDDTHYGRVEDVQMTILHMACYAFMERSELTS